MKSFKQFVKEARRNPELNPKVGATDYLRKYKDRDDIYISFTEINKIGINPESSYNTPIGVYTYPLKQFWKLYKVETLGTVKDSAPFAGDQPYIQILKGKHTKGFIRDFSKYTERDLKKDKEKILKYSRDDYFIEKQIEIGEKESYNKTPFGRFWGITWNLVTNSLSYLNLNSKKSSVAWNELLRNLGYTGFSDTTGTGIIYEDEPVQAVFLTSKEYTQIDMIDNKEYPMSEYEKTGVWKHGRWKGGTWKGGTWEDGTWQNGTWKNGYWECGYWEDGTWEDGTWENGSWEDGTWNGGTWKDGRWFGGTWKNGKWENGLWWKGTWCGGTWVEGHWVKGHWKCGRVYSKKFKGEICSSIDPQTFCQYESESDSFEELKSKVQ